MVCKRSLLLAFSTAAVFAVSSVQAQQQLATGWYIGGGLGKTDIELDNSDFDIPGTIQTRDESDTGWKFFAGYQFTRHFGAELTYANLGEASAGYSVGAAGSASVNYEASSWALAATARFPVGAFSILGRLGAARNEAELTVGSVGGALGAALTAAGLGAGTSSSKTRNSLYWGLGAQYDLARNFGVRLDYDNFGKFGNEEDTGRAKVELWTLNAVVRF
jgi:OmpA-OmpF porin, OOP family